MKNDIMSYLISHSRRYLNSASEAEHWKKNRKQFGQSLIASNDVHMILCKGCSVNRNIVDILYAAMKEDYCFDRRPANEKDDNGFLNH